MTFASVGGFEQMIDHVESYEIASREFA